LAKEDAAGQYYWLCSFGSCIRQREITKPLKLSLPEYMVQMIWIQLEYFPLTTNGKVADKKSLPDPDSSECS
jgi:hypothetical protein